MSKAFQCDNCKELRCGTPALRIHGLDICKRCENVLKMLNKLDYFELLPNQERRNDGYENSIHDI